MSDSRQAKGLHPAVVAGISVAAFAIFVPWAVVWIASIFVDIHNPETAAASVQALAFWLVVIVLAAEYLLRCDRARTR